MNSRLTTGFAALGCILLASCYPYDESRGRKPHRRPAPTSVAAPEQQALQAQRDAMKAKEDLARQEAAKIAAQAPTPTAPTLPTTPTPQPPAPPVVEKKPEYKYATKIPGKEGFVFSPYNNKMIDVRGMASGTLVQDPTYTGDGKGYFRVP